MKVEKTYTTQSLGELTFEEHQVTLAEAVETILKGLEGSEEIESRGRVMLLINIIVTAIQDLDHEYLCSDTFRWHCEVLNLDSDVLMEGIIERGDAPIIQNYRYISNNRTDYRMAAKLTQEQVDEIREYPKNTLNGFLAKKYNISTSQISTIRNKRKGGWV